MKKIIVSIMMALTIFAVSAQQKIDPEANGFNRKLKEQSAKITTITCGFTQTKHAAALANEVKMKGNFYFENGGKMCLDYIEPKGNQIVMNGEKFAIQTAGKRNVVSAASNPMLRQLSTMLQACMTGSIDQFNKGWLTEYFETAGEYIVEMVPTDKRAKKFVDKIVLNFNKQDMSLNRMKMVEPSGDYSQYEFTGKKFNDRIDERIFKI